MVSSTACPTDDAFVRLFEGQLPSADRDRLVEHVHVCSRCSLLLATPERAASRARSAGSAGGLLVASFEPGAILAGRYRIVRLLGAGGMGEVYEALDLSLNEPLALKTVRATAADDPRAMARLKSEVLLARRVTHPNVCRIFDFGVHGPEGADEQPLPFLTMELLTAAALDTAQQVAAGLHAAHRVKVIHKDLKAENVMLIEAAAGAGTRAVITDFGLAARPAPVDAGRDRAPGFSGTPGYVAPERLAGAPVTEANDVYALGVVMLDLLSGALPHERSQGRATVPETPGTAPLLALARRCQADDPGARPPLAEVRLALERLERPPARDASRAARWGWSALGAAAVLAAGLGLAGWRAKPAARAPAAATTRAAATNAPSAPPPAPLESRPESRPEPQPKADPEPVRPVAAAGRPEPRARPSGWARSAKAARGPRDDATAELLVRAEELLGAGRIPEACALVEAAVDRAPRTPAVFEFLGRCYMRLPDPETARRYHARYLEVAPDGPKAALVRALMGRQAP
jgi:hypothetical protein